MVCWPDASLRQVIVLPVPATPTEPAHEHGDLRFVLATGTPELARPERPSAPLRWFALSEAFDVVEPNLCDFLSRVQELLDR